MNQLLMTLIRINEKFNLPQFLQGENVPGHLKALVDIVSHVEDGEDFFQCYLFALVAMMCGLLATRSMQGALFMDETNAQTVLHGISCLQGIRLATPQAIY